MFNMAGLNQHVDLHMAFLEGFDPMKEVLGEVSVLEKEQEDVEVELKNQGDEVIATLQGLLRQILSQDPLAVATPQLESLKASVKEAKNLNERELKNLEAASKLFGQLQTQNQALRTRLDSAREAMIKKNANDPLLSFCVQAGQKAFQKTSSSRK